MSHFASFEKLPKVSLAFLPTPVHELIRLTKTLNGPRILIKRDDQTGLALGGNKSRKLEYLLGDALEKDIDTIITAGSIQSNHCRQTAAAAAKLGLRCELLLNSKPPLQLEGNALLDHLFGAKIHWSETDNLESIAKKVVESGHKPYVIPYGGSNSIGALGFVDAMIELSHQEKSITHIIVPSCSAGTQSGLVVGAKLTNFFGQVIGISIQYDIKGKSIYQNKLSELTNSTYAKACFDMMSTPDDFIVNYDYATGYGVVGELEKQAIRFLAQQEGILLDPVYTARAFGGLMDMVRTGRFTKNDTVLFWHTGGTPALFPYAKELV